MAGKKGRPKKNTTTTDNSTASGDNDDDVDTLAADIENEDGYITKTEFEKILQNQLKAVENNLKGLFKSELSLVKAEVLRLQDENEALRNENDNLRKKCEATAKNTDSMKEKLANYHAKLLSLEEAHHKQVEYAEDRVNRQLRKTLIFKGIPEKENESWDDTDELLAQKIADVCDGTSLEQAREMFERSHRGRVSRRYEGNGPRPIYAAFLSWRDSEFVKEEFRKHNIHHGNGVSCDQKFGPRTTARRNMALKERKRLKDTGQICSGYIKFPAILMVKDSQGAKYKPHKDYSKEPVHFN